MDNTVISQLYSFLAYIISGVLISVFFDIFRVLRKSFKTSDLVTYIEDIIFWLATGMFLLYVIFKFNNGEIRAYIFLGIALGVTLYILLFSKYFIKINTKIINILKDIICKLFNIIIYPIKLLRKAMLKPISFIIINIRKSTKKFFGILSNIKIKGKKTKSNRKKDVQKKDFA